MLENNHILDAVSQNLLWYYQSYDHQKAVEYVENSQGVRLTPYNRRHGIPDEIKVLFEVWRIGKVRQIKFNNQGFIQRMYIGKRYAKSFWHSELGTKVKPIFETPYQDQYGLIPAGVAVTIDQIKKDLKPSEMKYYETYIETQSRV
jgi:hypothetical protein